MATDPRRHLRQALAALAAVAGATALVVGGALTVSVEAADPAPAAADDSTSTAASTPTATESTPPAETSDPTTTPTSDPTDSASPTAPTTSPTTEPSSEPSTDPTTGPTEVDDAVLRWGINNESNNRAFAPDTFNFFSAGKIPDPGQGGTTIERSDWHARSGQVEIQKWNGSSWRRATWGGLSTDSTGAPLGAPTAGTFSNHQFVFSGGAGTVDPTAGTAHVTWAGDVTVLYYSGMSFFYISNPVLDIADGHGQLTGTVSGFASSVEDTSIWAPVPPATVVLADLPKVDLGDDTGLSADPAYLGVRISGLPQVTTGASWGAFPKTFVAFMDKLGTAAFWFSSGASTDAFKVPLPITVGWDGSPSELPPSTAPTTPPIEQPTPPTAKQPPPPAEAAPPGDALAPAPQPAAAAPALALPGRPDTAAVVSPTVVQVASTTQTHPGWWIGGGFLLSAAALLLVPGASRARTTA
ncbi:MAG: hypothetical protein QM714_15790 [Nocardioides sp.]|uniref:hypothetical protein n=1 Tax=Nocardioides sp. TaxID=35761 RepID=UPI0039E6A467